MYISSGTICIGDYRTNKPSNVYFYWKGIKMENHYPI